MRKIVLIAAALVAVMSPSGKAGLIINVGDHLLAPDQSGQPIQIFVQGGDPVQGLNFNAQIGDGSGASVPVFEGVDLINGTIFEFNHNPPNQNLDLPQVQLWTLTTAGGTVPAEGLFVTLTIDTTGVFSGPWDLNLKDTPEGPTNFPANNPPTGTLLPTITDGSIGIVPEPSSLALLLLGLLILAPISLRAVYARKRQVGTSPQ